MDTSKPNDGLTLREGYGEDMFYTLFNNPNIGNVLPTIYSDDPYSYKGCRSLVGSRYKVFNLLGDPTISLNLQKSSQDMFITHYSRIRGYSYQVPTIYAKGGSLSFYLDSKSKSDLSRSKIIFTDLDGKMVKEKKILCQRKNYCSGISNSKRPYVCGTRLDFGVGSFTCRVESAGKKADCPFWFKVNEDFDVKSMGTHDSTGLTKDEFLAGETVHAEITFINKRGARNIRKASLFVKDSSGKIVAQPALKCRNKGKNEKVCKTEFMPVACGTLTLLVNATDIWGSVEASWKIKINPLNLKFSVAQGSSFGGCANKPIKAGINFDLCDNLASGYPKVSLIGVKPLKEKLTCKPKKEGRVGCLYEFQVAKAGKYQIFAEARDKKGNRKSGKNDVDLARGPGVTLEFRQSAGRREKELVKQIKSRSPSSIRIVYKACGFVKLDWLYDPKAMSLKVSKDGNEINTKPGFGSVINLYGLQKTWLVTFPSPGKYKVEANVRGAKRIQEITVD
jgi:hypothetical protein